MDHTQWSYIAGYIYDFGFLVYLVLMGFGIVAIPNKTTWLIWFFVDVVTLLEMRQAHTDNPIIWGATVGAGVVATIGVLKGSRGWTKDDAACVLITAISLGTWLALNSPFWGIVCAVVATAVGFRPLLLFSLKHPEKVRKEWPAWAVWEISVNVAFFGISSLTFEALAQPVTFWAIETIMILIIAFHRPKQTAEGIVV